MKITYNYYVPLDGQGTLINPAYKWRVDERIDFCHHITQAGNLFYMMSSQGYVIRSIDPDKITKIEFADMVVTLKYNRFESFPFSASYDKTDGTHYQSQGAKEFGSILESIRQYTYK